MAYIKATGVRGCDSKDSDVVFQRADRDEDNRRRLSIGFNNFAHAVDHYVMLIFPTVVIGSMAVYGRRKRS